MVTSIPPCPTPCDPDCEAECHEEHAVSHKRGHHCRDVREALAAAVLAERERIRQLAVSCAAGYTIAGDRDLIHQRRPFADHPGLSGDAP